MADTYDPSENGPGRSTAPGVVVGDPEAFGEIVREHQARVYAFAARMLGGDAGAAQDVTQETFLRLWRQRDTYQDRGLLHAYLLRIANNLCQDARRARRPTVGLESCADLAAAPIDIESAVVSASLSDAVGDAVARLPEGQRAVFVLSHYEQLTYREIADILGCPIGTVGSRKYLALATLRKSLRHWMPEQE